MIYSNNLLEMLRSIVGLMGQMGRLDQIAPKVYAALYLMIHSTGR